MAAVLTNPTCNDYNDGSINITISGGTMPYLYSWSNGQGIQDASDLTAGTYFVTVTDGNDCQIVGGPYVLTEPAAVTIAVSGIVNTQCNASVGQVVLSSSDASTITLNGVTQASGTTWTGLAAGYYTATSNGACPASASFNIINTNSTLAATVSVANPLCNGGVVTATVTATGGTLPYSYVLNGSTTNGTGIFAGLTAGNYNVLVTDANGCTYYVSFDIDQPEALILALAEQTNILCQNQNTGSAIVIATGGTPGYTYAVTSGPGGTTVTGNIITGMTAGTYEVTVTDANNCTAILIITIEEINNGLLLLNCTSDLTVSNDPGSCSWTSEADQLNPTLLFNECAATLTWNIDFASGSTDFGNGNVPGGTIFPIGTSIVTYTLADEATPPNMVNCSFSVTVVEEEVPVLTCPSNVTFGTTTGICTYAYSPTIGSGSVTDNCSEYSEMMITYRVFNPDNSISETFNNAASYNFGLGVSQVEYSVTDESGNKTTCLQQVIILDTQAPQISCPAGSPLVRSNTPGLCGYVANGQEFDALATDNCGSIIFEHDFGNWADTGSLAGAEFPVGLTSVIWTATDEAGNESTCEIQILVEDNEAPSFINCPSGMILTVSLFSDDCEGGAIWSIPVAEDNCELFEIRQTSGPLQGTTLVVGTYEIEYVAEDFAGNISDTCRFFVNVIDTEDPFITCPGNLFEFATDADECSWTSPEGSLTPLLAQSNCPFLITWVVENPDGTIVNGLEDVSGYEFAIGTSMVTYTIIEPGSGQQWSCDFTVNVQDEEIPVIVCPENLILECGDVDNAAAINSWIGIALASDNCDSNVNIDSEIFSTDSQCGNTETFVYQFTATDEAGNINVCFANLTILDTTPPEIVLQAQNIEVECNANGNSNQLINWLNNNGFAQATDECGAITWANNYGTILSDCGLTGQVAVTFTATDACGNSSFTTATFMINDVTDPVWEIMPQDLTIECDGSSDPYDQIASWLNSVGGGEAKDDCSLIVYSNDYTGLSNGCSDGTGIAVVTFTASDACGNASTTLSTIRVTDNFGPVITTMSRDTLVDCDGLGNTDDLDSWLANNGGAEALDACSDFNWSYELISSLSGCSGTSVRRYAFVATDECGNESVRTEANFTVRDTIKPQISIPASTLTVDCDGQGNVIQRTNWLNNHGGAIANDICSGSLTWTYDLINEKDSCGITGRWTYRFTVTDGCGNDSHTIADFVIRDITPPVINTQAQPLVVECDGTNNVSDILNWLNNNGFASATDACGSITWTNNYGTMSGGCGTTGQILVTFTATDACGNSANTIATFMINDASDPVWEKLPSNLSIECDGSSDPYQQIEAWLNESGGAEAKDDCSFVVYSHNFNGLINGCSAGTGTALVTFTATDACGNSINANAVVTVEDKGLPVIQTAARDTIVECDGLSNLTDLNSWLNSHGGAVASDLCSEPLTWNYNLVETVQNCGGTSIQRYSFRATDACGNVSLHSEALFSIKDTTAPQFDVLPLDLVVQCDTSDNSQQLQDWLDSNAGLVAIDLCSSISNISYDLIRHEEHCGKTATWLYSFTVTDACGNINTAEASFKVEDTSAPVIAGGADMIFEECTDPAGNYPEFDFWLTNHAGADAVDGCECNVTWSNNFKPDNWVYLCGNSRFVDVTFYAEDCCGNVDSITHRFGIGDVTPPEFINCPRPDIVVDVPPNLCESYVNFSLPYAIDNCSKVEIEQTDLTGLTSGDQFPVGVTILEFTATDSCGNQATCQLRIIVKPNNSPPILSCPEDVVTVNDPGSNTAIVEDIAPEVTINCPGVVFVSYTIHNDDGDLIGSGVGDASGTAFPVGVNTVTCTAYDQPLVLITEIIQDGVVNGVEIGNFGPAAIDLGLAVVKRTNSSANEEYIQSIGTIVKAGEVHIVSFTGIPVGEEATYIIEYGGRIIDMLTINAESNGRGVYRISSIDTDTGADLEVINACEEGSYGTWNPQLPHYEDNGTIANMVSVIPNSTTCEYTVTVEDVESPVCAMTDTLSFSEGGFTIEGGSCVRSVFNLPAGLIARINIRDLIAEVDDAGLVTVTLTSPEGVKITLLDHICAGTEDIHVNLDDIAPTKVQFAGCSPLGNGSTFAPMAPLNTFFGAQSQGEWQLEMYSEGPNSGTLDNWTVEFLLQIPYNQLDLIAQNDPGNCGAVVSWIHPYFMDNSINGSMTVTYSHYDEETGLTNEETEIVLSSGGAIDLDGMPVSHYFEEGITTITYILTDEYGHESYCGFNITVHDTEAPVFTDGCNDLVFALNPGLCHASMTEIPKVTDNCGDYSISYLSPDGNLVDILKIPIGDNEIRAVASDIFGNADTCIFHVNVIGYEPENHTIACNEQINLSLDANCQAVITADMILEGNNYGCYDDYCLSILDENGQEHPNAFDYSDIGQTFMVTVTDCQGNGNNCMCQVTIMEKFVPEIECPQDAVVSCNASIHPSDLGYVRILNCEPFATIDYVDDFVDNGLCGNPRAVIYRNWIVNDHQGNIVNCVQTITIQKSTLDQVVFPQDQLDIPCHLANQDPLLTHPDQTGYPSVDGIGVNVNDGLCMFSYLWTDEVYHYCGNSYEILRTWKVRDMCGPVSATNPRTHIQLIKVFDSTPPQICSCEDVTVDANIFECEGSIELPLPCITDNCSDIKSVKVFVSGAAVTITGNYEAGTLKVLVYNMKLGTYDARWVVEDVCGNKSSCKFNIFVEDNSPPFAICQQNVQVGITLGGMAKVDAKSFDSGSWDNCQPVWFKVRRDDGGCMDLNGDNADTTAQHFDDDIYFCCEDIGQEVMVALRVFDVDPGAGPVNPDRMLPGGDLFGSYNECMATALVKDKTVPLMICEEKNITCEESKDPDHTGYPDIISTCGIFDLQYTDNLSALNLCGTGHFIRTWKVFVAGEQKGLCEQRINVTETVPFDPLSIVFPYITQDHCLKAEPTGSGPTWSDNVCGLVEASIIKVDTFRFVEDACYKILREWAVIDWCVYEPNTGAEINIDEYIYLANDSLAVLDPLKFTESDNDGYFRFTEVIMVNDDQAANIVAADTCISIETCVTAQNTHRLEVGSYESDEDCGGEYEWTYVIESECCHEIIQYSYNNNAFKGANYQGGVMGRVSDDKLFGTEASLMILPSLEKGRYKVTWTISDGCGNVTTEHQFVDVVDKKAPTPFLVDIATATMTEGCMVELNAMFFDKGACDNNCLASFDNCSDVLYFTFTPVLPKIDQTWSLDEFGLYYFNPLTGAKSNRSAYLGGTSHAWDPVKFTSRKVFFGPSRTIDVDVYVWDKFSLNDSCDDGNYDYATVELSINSDGDVDCTEDLISLSGFIYNTANESGINNVEVGVESNGESMYRQTDPSGNFSFTLPEGEYDITPRKRDDYSNGVNTLDLVLIQRHILGIDALAGDQLIAADANANSTITAVDIKQIRDLILGVTTKFPVNDSWVFLPTELNAVVSEPVELRFGGIKIGDVNRNAVNNYSGLVVSPRHDNSIELMIDEKVVKPGDEIRLEIRAKHFIDVKGMQFTLNTEGMKFTDFEPGKLNLSSENIGRIREQLTTLSWNETTGVSATEDEVLFTLIFEGQEKSNLSSSVRITSEITPAEGYVTDELLMRNVDLDIRGLTPGQFELHQNEPNPFAQSTMISFILPEKGAYELKVYDVSGKELMMVNGEGRKGLNEETLKGSELNPGVLYYQLKFKDFVANKKMILIK